MNLMIVHKGSFGMGEYWFNYTIIKEKTNELGFDLYLVDINGLLDREKVYGTMMIQNVSLLFRLPLWIGCIMAASPGYSACA